MDPFSGSAHSRRPWHYTRIGNSRAHAFQSAPVPISSGVLTPSANRRLLKMQLVIWYALIVGCGRPPSAPAGQGLPTGGRVVFIGPAQTDPSSDGVLGGAAQAARGVDALQFDFIAPSGPGIPPLLEQLDRALAAQPAAICLFVASEPHARALCDHLQRFDGLLVTVGARPAQVEPFAHVAADWCQGAELLAEAVNASLEKLARRSYVLLHADGRSELETNIARRFRSAMARFTRVTLLDQAALGASIPPRSPPEQIADLLAHFRHAGLVVTLDPQPWTAPGLFRLAEPHHFATLGASPALWPRLRSGEAVALVGPRDGDLGRIAIERAVRGLTGDTSARGSVLVPCEVVTADSLDAFRERFERAARPVPTKR